MSCVSVIMTMMTMMITIRMMMMKWLVALLCSESPCLVFNDLYRPI